MTAFPFLNMTDSTDADILNLLQLHSTQLASLSTSLPTITSSTDLLRNGVDASWVLFGSYLVFIMSLGLILLESGSVKAMNAKNVMMQCAMTNCISIMGFYLIGFGMTQGTQMGFGDMTEAAVRTKAHFPAFLFLWGFSNATGLIVVGSTASRISMLAFLVLIATVCWFIFPIVAYAVWSHGFLSPFSTLTVIDFAGGMPVHIVGGVASFVAAWIIGPRYDRFIYNRETGAMEDHKEPGHSIVFAVLGTFLLWFGWFGFNSGSTGGMTNGRELVAGHAAVNTLIAAGVGSLSLTGYHMLFSDVHNLWELLNGLLCGLVAITPCAATVPPWAAILIGAGSVLAYRGGVRLLEYLRVDDVIDSFAVHACCGAYGCIAAALLSTQAYCDQWYGVGVLNYNPGRQLGVHLLGIIVTALFTSIATAVPLLILKQFQSLRVTVEDEKRGLDLSLHGGYAYPDFKEKMSILKNQVVLEAELGAALKSAGKDKNSRSSDQKIQVVTEKIRELDEMRKISSGSGEKYQVDKSGLSSGTSNKRGTVPGPNEKSGGGSNLLGTPLTRGVRRATGGDTSGTNSNQPIASRYLLTNLTSTATEDEPTGGAPSAAWGDSSTTPRGGRNRGLSNSNVLSAMNGSAHRDSGSTTQHLPGQPITFQPRPLITIRTFKSDENGSQQPQQLKLPNEPHTPLKSPPDGALPLTPTTADEADDQVSTPPFQPPTSPFIPDSDSNPVLPPSQLTVSIQLANEPSRSNQVTPIATPLTRSSQLPLLTPGGILVRTDSAQLIEVERQSSASISTPTRRQVSLTSMAGAQLMGVLNRSSPPLELAAPSHERPSTLDSPKPIETQA